MFIHIAGLLFKCDLSYSCASIEKISTDISTTLGRSICDSLASDVPLCYLNEVALMTSEEEMMQTRYYGRMMSKRYLAGPPTAEGCHLSRTFFYRR